MQYEKKSWTHALGSKQYRENWDRIFRPLPFQTTTEEVDQLPAIKEKMVEQGLDSTFVDQLVEIARDDQGVFDLMKMWVDEPNEQERKLTEQCLQDSIDDYSVDY
jgi:hypothetical protein